MVSRVVGKIARLDSFYGGTSRIAGTTAVSGSPSNTPVSRRVRLHDQLTGRVARETWSDSAGLYAFEGLRPDVVFHLVSFDHTGVHAAVAEADITPEPMP